MIPLKIYNFNHMNKGRFQSVVNSEKPVLVDFYADWCMP
ncbi:MAG: thioredoxin family protein, partial [Mariniphaga sp.]|nr:thioredoxin family protein [Mariniphaga sp.]